MHGIGNADISNFYVAPPVSVFHSPLLKLPFVAHRLLSFFRQFPCNQWTEWRGRELWCFGCKTSSGSFRGRVFSERKIGTGIVSKYFEMNGPGHDMVFVLRPPWNSRKIWNRPWLRTNAASIFCTTHCTNGRGC